MYNDIPIYGEDDNNGEWGDDPQSPTDRNRDRSASVGRNTGRGPDSWRNNFSDENDDFDEYDRQERGYKQQMYVVFRDTSDSE